MRILVAVEHMARLAERVATLLMELTVAAVVVFGAIYIGHELREWREWYWALPPTFGEAPSAPAVSEP
jgi:hypothetical protein